MNTTIHHDSEWSLASRDPAFGAGSMLEGAARIFDAAVRHYRWLLFTLPFYALAAAGTAAWPLAFSLAAAAFAYNTTLAIAERHWPDWVSSRTLYLRCIEIGLVCIGLSLTYLWSEGLENQFYYDAFYGVFVVLASLGTGRRGVFISAALATLAVAVGQAMLAPDLPLILTSAGAAYWFGVSIYSGTFGLFFLAIGLLTRLAAEGQGRRAEEARASLEVGAAALRQTSDRQRIVSITAHRERLATLGEITARVIHGLGGPLTGITTLVDDLIESGVSGDPETLELVRTEAERAALMVRELLVFARRESEDTLVSVNELAERAIALWTLADRCQNVDLVRELCPQPTFIVGAQSQLEQAILNLLDNAQHAVSGRPDGRIVVRTSHEGGAVVLEVEDNGPGIPREAQERVFEPFFTTKAPGVGTGLGLAIVESVVRECGGTVAVRSRPGRGATFSLRLTESD
ncbi:MAG: HAMP domain-containing histidine kinase [Gemmatimonadetes bacterium]|uniref:histidine kinase n=1 Tax=Candidatus Kutchimonas denitrificans TaxID=3056748 RepID=A0AAE5CAB6_9BACT|nr:HAMP domain-containing histidine kinase [Gemmatimonadota bacterium]NIR76321.1 HAMP domain-containing histidine kinase [Candidatus Kutchimonas denitrificans]NIS02344.1 HAMP domain-containing histidine kinase [Gemmatimonadota bacterium]NIT68163.1 HAMP domain-containing histidine kinase [Gemmatimonadota bacterium]NIU54387.1 GHKL domain-containing protein [Gemmatimonadota bacterium]